MPPPPPKSTLFPYTTLFRSRAGIGFQALQHLEAGQARHVEIEEDAIRSLLLGPRKERPDCIRSEEHTSELQSHSDLVCRLLLEKKKDTIHDSRRTARDDSQG